jgi:hypothetical protein
MDIGADIFIGASTPPDVLRTATARVFRVPVDRVAYHAIDDDPWPDADVVLEVWDNTPAPGDYPLQILPWFPDDRVNDSATLSALAQELGAPILTAADSYDPADQELYLPDGTMERVSVWQDDDGGFRNTKRMQHLIERHSRRVAIAS